MSSDPAQRRQTVRCAIYTRKSTEEGLDQSFNSLDAQHEACAAFIVSQAGLGWKLLPDRYDDGGISGGTMNRPGLQRLLQDIRDRRVDVVVVYKIDRLTRSLADFAKMVEVFDAVSVSFVSVTQQFNTTSSMGRLTLNVLLSFAQFEREVTAERIRDKIAASKKKGMWMGGTVPFGYRVENRLLQVDESEAAIVRHLFARYLELGSVQDLAQECAARGLSTRSLLRRNGETVTTMPFGRGNLYHLLSNPIYVGKIRHRDAVHEGQHEALIDRNLFDDVQTRLASQAPTRRSARNTGGRHILAGLLVDEQGQALRTEHATKQGRRYRYYVSKPGGSGGQSASDLLRLPATEIETAVCNRIGEALADRRQLADWVQAGAAVHELDAIFRRGSDFAETLLQADNDGSSKLLKEMLRRIVIRPGMLRIEIRRRQLLGMLLNGRDHPSADVPQDDTVAIDCPIALRRRGVEMKMIVESGKPPARPDASLINLIVRAHRFLDHLTSGTASTLSEVATACNAPLSEVSRILPLAFLSPRITRAILAGEQPVELTTQKLLRIGNLPTAWEEQATELGF